MRIATTGIALTLGLTLGVSGCADDGADVTTITVFAAASLTDTFTEIGERFEAENPGVAVEFAFDGSSTLVTQLQEGAPADVFASADTATMDQAVDAGLPAADPVDFATNTLQIAVPPDNPAEVDDLADLADPDTVVVVCAPAVPCGAASTAVEEAAGIELSPVSEEQNVTDVLNKVSSGEADAGLVYVTDVARADGSVLGVPFDESDSAVNRYPIAPLESSADAELTQAFVDFVVGPVGRGVLANAGFGAP